MPFLGSKDSVNIDLTKYDTYATTRPCLGTERDVASEFFSTEIHDQSEFINKMYIVCNLTSILTGSFFFYRRVCIFCEGKLFSQDNAIPRQHVNGRCSLGTGSQTSSTCCFHESPTLILTCFALGRLCL